jgi:hypothetical protein
MISSFILPFVPFHDVATKLAGSQRELSESDELPFRRASLGLDLPPLELLRRPHPLPLVCSKFLGLDSCGQS